MTVKEKIEELRAELHRHNYNYYVLNTPEISDKEFDDMMRELQDLEQAYPEYKDDNSPTMRVGSDLNKNFTQVPHKYPMLSLGNTYSENEVTDFYERVKKALNEDFEICCEMKYDGTSISLTYEDGKLVRAVTRGDGEKGDDVTDNVKTIRTIPLVLHGSNYPQSFEIRGEILMSWDVFEELNREKEAREEPLFANPRNAASGTLKLQNSSIVASRKLDAYLYYLLGENLPYDGHYENLQEAAKWGFKISNAMRKCRTLEEILGCRTEKPAGCHGWYRTQGKQSETAKKFRLYCQIPPMGHCIQISGRTCSYTAESCNLPSRKNRSCYSGSQPRSGTAFGHDRKTCITTQRRYH